ncbi:MAG: rRNA pseudouridine synthase [Clostridia bacterium]|nr:rRNA pseudouridine synthase [Clostridia bacterium]
MRLDKFLAECGFGTRTEVKKLIKSGCVEVKGDEKVRPETHIDENSSEIFVNGKKADYRKFVYLILNKPSGFISATWDKKLPTVIDLVPEEYIHFDVSPVGRLDIDTEGLLLLTNDGDLNHRLLSPKNHVPKTYIAKLLNPVKNEDIETFKKGMDLGDFETLPSTLEIISQNEPYTAKVTICEGKFHQVKRMFEKVNNKVLYLKRIKMKNLILDENLDLGKVRELTNEELEDLLK